MLRTLLFLVVCCATLVGLFYAFENARGRWAWSSYKKELEAKGERIDFDSYLPPTVPDAENLFKAPIMMRLNSTNGKPYNLRVAESGFLNADISQALPSDLPEWNDFFGLSDQPPLIIATVQIVSPKTNTPSKTDVAAKMLPLIFMDDAPLPKAIDSLAAQAGIHITRDPKADAQFGQQAPNITIRFENVTARQALDAVLDNHGLEMTSIYSNTFRIHAKEIATITFEPYVPMPKIELPPEKVLPKISIENKPLIEAIKDLALQAGMPFQKDPKVDIKFREGMPNVSLHLQNTSARQALNGVLDNHGLAMVPTHAKIFRLVTKDLIHPELDFQPPPSVPDGPQWYSRISFNDTTLTNAIQHVGDLAGMEFEFHPRALKEFEQKGRDGGRVQHISYRMVTAQGALGKLLEEYALKLTTNTTGKIEMTFQPRRAPNSLTKHRTAVEILEDFRQFDADFDALYAACERPQAVLDTNYKNVSTEPQRSFWVPLRVTCQSLALRASCELALNKNSDALRDISAGLRFSDSITNEPFLLHGMLRVAFQGVFTSPIWEGLAARRWNEQQLKELQGKLSRTDLIHDAGRFFRSHRAYENFGTLALKPSDLKKILEYPDWREDKKKKQQLRRLYYAPRGWTYQNLALENRLYQENVLSTFNPGQSIIYPDQVDAGQKRTELQYTNITYKNFIAEIQHPGFAKALFAIALNQTSINEATIGCALERYRLEHGNFPERLDALSPQFLVKIPHDVINGQPLKYQRTSDGQYILYSIGWDQKDDGGKAMRENWSRTELGDWVWRFPTKRQALN